jgi:sulfate transport system ATP-binding protein
LHITSILVTHDQEEALEAADRIVVLNQGHIEQTGTPEEVYENPTTPFVYQFLGDVNVFHGRMSHDETVHEEADRQPPAEGDSSDEHEVTFVRPHDLELSRSRTTRTQLEATVRFVIAAGSRVRLELVSKDSPQIISVELTKDRYRELRLQQGDVVFVHPKQLQVFKMPGPSSM